MTTPTRNSAPTLPIVSVHGWPRHDRRLRLIDAATSCPVGRTKLAHYLWEQAEALMHPYTPAQPQQVAALGEVMRRLAALRAQEDTLLMPRPRIDGIPWPRKFHTMDAEIRWQWYSSQEREIQARAESARVQASTLRAIVEASASRAQAATTTAAAATSTTTTPNQEDNGND